MTKLYKLALTAILLLLCSGHAHAQTVVNSCIINYDGGGSDQCTIATVGAGHMIVAFLETITGTCPDFSFSDSFSIMYSTPTMAANTLQCNNSGEEFGDVAAMVYGLTGSNSGSDTFTLINPQFAFSFAVIAEISGINTFDVAAGAVARTGTSPVSGSLTTSLANEFLVAGSFTNGTSSLTIPVGYSLIGNINGGGNNYALALAYMDAGAAGPYSATFTAGSSTQWEAILGAFYLSSPAAVSRIRGPIY